MVEKREPVVRLERGFWIITAVFAVLSIAAVVYWYYAPVSSWLPVGAKPAEEIDELFKFMAAIASVLFIGVFGYLLYFSFTFRAKKSDAPGAIGVQIHDHHGLELWWTIIPAILVIVLSALSVKIWYQIQIQPNNGLVVESIGHQWYYTFRYPQVHGEITDAMHLPVNEPVTLNVTSADVIHSFWVPAFRLKADMVPGLINTLRFTPTLPGTYKIICTEFCGTQHAEMEQQVVVVESKAKWEAWYHGWQQKNANVSDALPKAGGGAIALAGGDPKAGQALFATKCSGCHAVGPFDQKIVGPGLRGILDDPKHPNLVDGAPANPADVAKILQNGYKGDYPVAMPNQTANGLSDKDIANLVAYLGSLK